VPNAQGSRVPTQKLSVDHAWFSPISDAITIVPSQ
jgi:hypothetical protein